MVPAAAFGGGRWSWLRERIALMPEIVQGLC